MSRRLVIAIDCDDVLIETTPYIIDAYNRQFGTAVSLPRAYDSENPEWECSDRDILLQRFSNLQQTSEYAAIEPLGEAIVAVRKLATNHELHLITASPQSSEVVTAKMLDMYFPGCFTTVEHVGKSRPKGEVCRQIGADVLVDDNLKNLLSALDHKLPAGGALHFGNYPWQGHDSLPEGVVECLDWDQVNREVTRIAG